MGRKLLGAALVVLQGFPRMTSRGDHSIEARIHRVGGEAAPIDLDVRSWRLAALGFVDEGVQRITLAAELSYKPPES